MDNDLETLLNETLDEFPGQDKQDLNEDFIKQFSQNIQESLKTETIKETLSNIRSEKEENVDDILDNLNSLMDNVELDSLLANVMDQIVSKELLYEPLKDLASKYPDYLSKAKDTIPLEDYNRFEKQYKIVSEIIAIYDVEDDPVKVMQLMQDVSI